MAKKKEKEEVKVERVSITRSYQRKLNLAIHGGSQFETLDIMESRTAHDIQATDADAVGKQLHEQCRDAIETAIEEYDKLASEEVKSKAKRDEIAIDKGKLVAIKDILQDLIDARTLKDLAKLQEAIKARQDLDNDQLDYLRKKYNLKAKELKKNGSK